MFAGPLRLYRRSCEQALLPDGDECHLPGEDYPGTLAACLQGDGGVGAVCSRHVGTAHTHNCEQLDESSWLDGEPLATSTPPRPLGRSSEV